jgi:2-oxoisovalerate dehydrogenase E1 component
MTEPPSIFPTQAQARRWLRVMATSRFMDKKEESLIHQGKAVFQLSSAGHESLAVLADLLTPEDWVFPHYRDRPLLLARGVTPVDLFCDLFAKADSGSGGRQMPSHFSNKAHRVVSFSSPVGSGVSHGIGVALNLKQTTKQDAVLVMVGDASTQEGEVYESLAYLGMNPVPLVLCVEDNGYGISTATRGKTFWTMGKGEEATEFLGTPIIRVDGSDPWAVYLAGQEAFQRARQERKSTILVVKIERLASHTSSDDQGVYRSQEELLQATQKDPLSIFSRFCLEQNLISQTAWQAIQTEVQKELEEAAIFAEALPDPDPAKETEIFPPQKPPLSLELKPLLHKMASVEGNKADSAIDADSITLRRALNNTLHYLLETDPRVFLFGQDIEDPKGDVFGVTKGLSTHFPGRVENSPLAEATILGTGIGRALAGERPICFLQFIDFMGPGLNQIISELSTLYWRSKGEWQAPLLILAPVGAYRAGMGPWHSQTGEGTLGHIPGIDIVMPAHPEDAVETLLQAFHSDRPTVYLYPKILLNRRYPLADLAGTSARDHRLHREGKDLTLVGWGGTVDLCKEAANRLHEQQVDTEVLEITSLSPLPLALLSERARRTGRMVVVHEDNRTAGLGAEILAELHEQLGSAFQGARVTRSDTHISYNIEAQLAQLPSVEKIVTAAQKLLGRTVYEQAPAPVIAAKPAAQEVNIAHTVTLKSQSDDRIAILVPRVAPTDEAATLLNWVVALGEKVEEGQHIADLQGDKALFELEATCDGYVAELLASPGQDIYVGDTVAYLSKSEPQTLVTSVNPVQAIAPEPEKVLVTSPKTPDKTLAPSLVSIAAYLPDGVITNRELAERLGGVITEEWIEQRTGILERRLAPSHIDTSDMGLWAAERALDQIGMKAQDLDMILVSTTSADGVIPSVACRLKQGLDSAHCPAFDLSAACSGFIYGLSVVQQYLKVNPDQRILLVTAEKMSKVINPLDPDTAIIFGDGAVACVLTGQGPGREDYPRRLELEDVMIRACPDHERTMVLESDFIHMQGARTFRTAVTLMGEICEALSQKLNYTWDDVDWLVPHQANGRIIQAIARRLAIDDRKVFSNIAYRGNTSSASIPLALTELLDSDKLQPGQRILLCALGGGITYGAASVKVH